MSEEIYRYLNFDQIESFQKSAAQAVIPAINVVEVA
jgi:aconitase B